MHTKYIQTKDYAYLKTRKFNRYSRDDYLVAIQKACRKSESDGLTYFVAGGGKYSTRYTVQSTRPGFVDHYCEVSGWEVKRFGPDTEMIALERAEADYRYTVSYYEKRYGMSQNVFAPKDKPIPASPDTDATIKALGDIVRTIARDNPGDPALLKLMSELRLARCAFAESAIQERLDKEYHQQTREQDDSEHDFDYTHYERIVEARRNKQVDQHIAERRQSTQPIALDPAKLAALESRCKRFYTRGDSTPHVGTENLLKAVMQAGRAVSSSRPSLPVLSTLHLQSANGKLRVTGTNLELAISATCAYTGPALDVCVPAQTFQDLLTALKDGASTVQLMQWSAYLPSKAGTTARAAVSGNEQVSIFGGPAKANLKAVSALEFPPIQSVGFKPVCQFPSGTALVKYLTTLVQAVAKDDNRPVLTGVKVALGENGLSMTASDGYKVATVKPDYTGRRAGETTCFIVPGNTLAQLAKMVTDSPVTLAVWTDETGKATRVQLSFDDTSVTSQLIDGLYPDVEVIVPTVFSATAEFDLDDLLQKVKNVKAMAGGLARDSKLKPIYLATVAGGAGRDPREAVLSAESNEHGRTEVTIGAVFSAPVDMCLDGVRFWAALNELSKQSKKPTKAQKSKGAVRTLNMKIGTSGVVLLESAGAQQMIHKMTVKE